VCSEGTRKRAERTVSHSLFVGFEPQSVSHVALFAEHHDDFSDADIRSGSIVQHDGIEDMLPVASTDRGSTRTKKGKVRQG
jgi:hypothetical protein